MKKSTKMVEELSEKRKISRSVVNSLIQKIFLNMIVAICLILLNLFINMVYLYIDINISSIILKICAMVSVILSIILFEITYRKESREFLFFGIEVFINAIIVLCIPKIYEHLDNLICTIFLLFPVFCVVYYTVKSIIIYNIGRITYENNLSDIKEIRQSK